MRSMLTNDSNLSGPIVKSKICSTSKYTVWYKSQATTSKICWGYVNSIIIFKNLIIEKLQSEESSSDGSKGESGGFGSGSDGSVSSWFSVSWSSWGSAWFFTWSWNNWDSSFSSITFRGLDWSGFAWSFDWSITWSGSWDFDSLVSIVLWCLWSFWLWSSSIGRNDRDIARGGGWSNCSSTWFGSLSYSSSTWFSSGSGSSSGSSSGGGLDFSVSVTVLWGSSSDSDKGDNVLHF
ncbi:hypothetical protein BC833DRAFT_443654 [Globomyces pollinis-pini]|nr:hypothetical protein BC833DRAFT_443654 [Globomyces pollinis-pini]